ncbi:MAG: hypothetical protein U0S36_13845 [Candidatus Nanopelagicales bacterium]
MALRVDGHRVEQHPLGAARSTVQSAAMSAPGSRRMKAPAVTRTVQAGGPTVPADSSAPTRSRQRPRGQPARSSSRIAAAPGSLLAQGDDNNDPRLKVAMRSRTKDTAEFVGNVEAQGIQYFPRRRHLGGPGRCGACGRARRALGMIGPWAAGRRGRAARDDARRLRRPRARRHPGVALAARYLEPGGDEWTIGVVCSDEHARKWVASHHPIEVSLDDRRAGARGRRRPPRSAVAFVGIVLLAVAILVGAALSHRPPARRG